MKKKNQNSNSAEASCVKIVIEGQVEACNPQARRQYPLKFF